MKTRFALWRTVCAVGVFVLWPATAALTGMQLVTMVQLQLLIAAAGTCTITGAVLVIVGDYDAGWRRGYAVALQQQLDEDAREPAPVIPLVKASGR